MVVREIMATTGQRHLFAGLLISVLGIALICVIGAVNGAETVHSAYAGATLICIGVLIWLYGAALRENELLNAAE